MFSPPCRGALRAARRPGHGGPRFQCHSPATSESVAGRSSRHTPDHFSRAPSVRRSWGRISGDRCVSPGVRSRVVPMRKAPPRIDAEPERAPADPGPSFRGESPRREADRLDFFLPWTRESPWGVGSRRPGSHRRRRGARPPATADRGQPRRAAGCGSTVDGSPCVVGYRPSDNEAGADPAVTVLAGAFVSWPAMRRYPRIGGDRPRPQAKYFGTRGRQRDRGGRPPTVPLTRRRTRRVSRSRSSYSVRSTRPSWVSPPRADETAVVVGEPPPITPRQGPPSPGTSLEAWLADGGPATPDG
jgi:hypothetical protein